jgi:transketolase
VKSQREVWGNTLAELADDDERILIVDGDLATSTKADIFAARHPDKFIEVGIAEQGMVGVAFGLSTLGYRPWLSSFGVFLTHRALDPVRMLVSQTHAPVRIAGAYSGLLNGSSGKTHQDLEDFAIMRAMPNMAVIAPVDEIETEAAIRWAVDHDGPLYIRIARDAVDPVFTGDLTFRLGAVHLLRDGRDVTLVSTGAQTSRTLAAAALLEQRMVSARVVHVPTLKPVDESALLRSVAGGGQVFTVEDHSTIGGLGGLVSEVSASSAEPFSVTRLGLADHWAESAPNAFLLDKYGLSAEAVAAQVVAAIQDSTEGVTSSRRH